jgi:hypothetical protein
MLLHYVVIIFVLIQLRLKSSSLLLHYVGIIFVLKQLRLKSSSMLQFSIQHRPGNKHGNADSMSRCPSSGECLCSHVDSMEYLNCGPCKKCIKRAVETQRLTKFLTNVQFFLTVL